MFTSNDIKTVGQLVTFIENGFSDKMEGTISEDRKITVYKIKLQDTIRIDIRGKQN